MTFTPKWQGLTLRRVWLDERETLHWTLYLDERWVGVKTAQENMLPLLSRVGNSENFSIIAVMTFD